MKSAFFITGPTAAGKSEIAADVALKVGGEVVSADAFQIYHGFEILTAKPSNQTLAKVPHHLIGTVSPVEEMNAEKFRRAACEAIEAIRSRGKMAIVTGGSGLYLKALTDGLSAAPGGNAQVRNELKRLTTAELQRRLTELDPNGITRIDRNNRRRLIRALEICLMTGKPMSLQKSEWTSVHFHRKEMEGGAPATQAAPRPGRDDPVGVFIFRDRDELYQRINRRVEAMFTAGVVAEVAGANALSATASKMIGLAEIRQHLEGKLSIAECIQKIQQATRRYAKRQLTWFRRQTNFDPLNLSLLSHHEAVEWISRWAIACRA